MDDAAKARQAMFGRRFRLMTLPASFSTHQDPFAFGDVPCTWAGMPEAAIDENRHPPAGEDRVGAAAQTGDIQAEVDPEPEAAAM